MRTVKLSKPHINQDQVRYITNLPDSEDHSGTYVPLEDVEELVKHCVWLWVDDPFADDIDMLRMARRAIKLFERKNELD